MSLRIMLNDDDFFALIRGKAIRKATPASSDLVEIALADIGFHRMHALFNAAVAEHAAPLRVSTAVTKETHDAARKT